MLLMIITLMTENDQNKINILVLILSISKVK